MLLLAPPKPVLLLPPPKEICEGSRVVWSAKGKKMLESYFYRYVPKDGVFTVEKIFYWSNGKHTAKLRELKSPTYIENLERAAV